MFLENLNSRKIYLNFINIFFFVCCFPWVSFSTNSMDSQPWALLIGSLILLSDKRTKIPKYIFTAFVITFFGLIISIYRTSSMPESYPVDLAPWILRSIANYSSFYVVLILSWNALSRGYERLKLIQIVKISTLIYYLFSIIEYYFPSIIEFIGNARPSGGRGLTSLTPEPTFFAVFIIFASLIIFAARGFSFKEDKYMHFLNIFGVIFIAQSASGILILSIIFLGNIIRRLLGLKINKKDIFILISLCIIFFIVIPLFLKDIIAGSRAYGLFLRLIANPTNIYLVDESVRTRVGNIIVSIYIAFSKYLIPQGILGLKYIASEYTNIFDGAFIESNESKIMSWTGDWIFTLGIFGISSLLIFFMKIRDRIYTNAQYYFLAIFFIISFIAIPISFPFSAILISLLLTNQKDKNLIIKEI